MPAGAAVCPGRHGSSRPLPLASPPAVPLDAVYGVSRIDASGRLTGQVITEVLGWRPGDRLTLTAGAGVVVARRDPGGMVAVLARGAVAIPVALRHRCGLGPATRCCWRPCPARTRSPPTPSRWSTRRCGRTPRWLQREGARS